MQLLLLKIIKLLALELAKLARVGSAEIACKNALSFFQMKSQDHLRLQTFFFPFADGLENLIQAGVKSIIQPGGSIRDQGSYRCS